MAVEHGAVLPEANENPAGMGAWDNLAAEFIEANRTGCFVKHELLVAGRFPRIPAVKLTDDTRRIPLTFEKTSDSELSTRHDCMSDSGGGFFSGLRECLDHPRATAELHIR